MQTQEIRRLTMALTALAETFREKISETTVAAYSMALDDLPIDAIEKAAKRAMREKTFFPAAHELRALAGDIPPDQRAVIAWQAVLKALRRHGYTATVDFDDRAINAAIRTMGGWEALSDRLDTDETQWVRKEFEATYKVFCQRGVTAEEARPLAGFFDRTNHGNGHEVQRPVALIETTLTPAKQIGGPARRVALPAPEAARIGVPEDFNG
jgi:hypothetical protein